MRTAKVEEMVRRCGVLGDVVPLGVYITTYVDVYYLMLGDDPVERGLDGPLIDGCSPASSMVSV
jgi:hypothetical protein